jgi:hypothetical protein
VPTKTTFADGWENWDWRKIIAVATIAGTVAKIAKGRKVGPSEAIVAATALWGLLGKG